MIGSTKPNSVTEISNLTTLEISLHTHENRPLALVFK